ncbi:MAG: response regulator [Anaerolineaceae bacterium]
MDVLIVDDSAAIRKILQRVLRQTELGFGEIIEAANGAEALDKLEKQDFGLVLSDINMPTMDGIEFLREIRRRGKWPNLPIMMITTEVSQSTVEEAVQCGAKGYVGKPFTAEHIRDKLTELIG